MDNSRVRMGRAASWPQVSSGDENNTSCKLQEFTEAIVHSHRVKVSDSVAMTDRYFSIDVMTSGEYGVASNSSAEQPLSLPEGKSLCSREVSRLSISERCRNFFSNLSCLKRSE